MKSNNILRQTLNRFNPAIYHIHIRKFSDRFKLNPATLIDYGIIKDIRVSEEAVTSMSKELDNKKSPLLNLAKPKVLQVATEDIEISDKDKFGTLTIASAVSFHIRYGEYGIMPSLKSTPTDLLTKELLIQGGSLGVLSIKKHVPFLIDSKDPSKTIVLNATELREIYKHEENITRYSMDKICDLKPERARQISLALESQIFDDRNNELFYEEVTSKVYKPTKYNKSSGTLMNFTNNDPRDKTTAMHYHPGDRVLMIVTTNQTSGITLNFCGVAENPEHKKDCEKFIEFPKNSMIVVNFPAYTHHKFMGNFNCISIHPKEGENLISAVQSGTLPRGFLESATVFSKTKNEDDSWKLSVPEEVSSKSNSR